MGLEFIQGLKFKESIGNDDFRNGGNMMKRDLVDELYKTAYKRYREKYPNKDFASIPNFLDSLWFSIEGELNRNGYNAAKKYVEEAELIILK